MTSKLVAITFLVKDYGEAIAWFCDVLDFALIENTDMGAGKRWVVVESKNSVRLLLAKADGAKQTDQIGRAAGGRVAFFLNTDNFQQDHARMILAGVQFKETPRHEPYGTVAVFEDLYGNLWDLIEPTKKP